MNVECEVSGYDFVRAMMLAGYRVVGMTKGHARIAKGETELLVPQLDDLGRDLLVFLLQRADMKPVRLASLLTRLRSSETWPEQGETLRVTTDARE